MIRSHFVLQLALVWPVNLKKEEKSSAQSWRSLPVNSGNSMVMFAFATALGLSLFLLFFFFFLGDFLLALPSRSSALDSSLSLLLLLLLSLGSPSGSMFVSDLSEVSGSLRSSVAELSCTS